MPKPLPPEAVAEPVWKNRIVGLTNEDPKTLKPNPKNFRRHPLHQKRIFGAAVNEVGIVAPVVVNDRTGFLLDGHMRVEEAVEEGVAFLPVIHVDLSEDEETTALLTLDAVSAMAMEDAIHKADVLKNANTENDVLAEYFAREFERQEAEAQAEQDLADLANEYGEHDPRSFWPVIRMRVSPDVRVRFLSFFKGMNGGDDSERLDAMLDRLHAPRVDPEEFSEVAGD